jgi:hypothetical protein
LVRLADTLDACIGRFLQAREGLLGTNGWEAAPREGWALSNLMVRNVEAVLLMARTDEVMVSAAWTNARCAFEQAVRIAWMLYAADPYTNECRWLGFLADAERFHRLVADAADMDPDPPNSTAHRELEHVMRTFREGVTARLPDGYEPEKPPNFEAMLRAVNGGGMYRYYREGSQYVHGSLWGTTSYRQNFGVKAKFGEFTRPSDWILPLRLCWLSLCNAGRVLLDRLGDTTHTCDWQSMEASVNSDFETLVLALEHPPNTAT